MRNRKKERNLKNDHSKWRANVLHTTKWCESNNTSREELNPHHVLVFFGFQSSLFTGGSIYSRSLVRCCLLIFTGRIDVYSFDRSLRCTHLHSHITFILYNRIQFTQTVYVYGQSVWIHANDALRCVTIGISNTLLAITLIHIFFVQRFVVLFE